MARIAVGGLHHETNCFVSGRTDYAYFAMHRDRPPLVRDAEIFDWLPNANFGLSGFMERIGKHHELVPTVWTSGGAGALVSRDAFERIAGELVGTLSRRLPVDAVYLDLHGAGCTEDFEDMEGELLRRVRAAIGPDIPLVISLDYHATVTPIMVELTDALLAYHTYPHVDRPGTGERAADSLERILRDGRPKGRAMRKIPFLIPLTWQCTQVDPSKMIVERTKAGVGGDILSFAYLAGFPPSDLSWCGPTVIAHAYSQNAAEAAVAGLAHEIAMQEANFEVPEYDPDTGVKKAMEIAASASKPVTISDTQDNPGAGGTADTTGVLEALVRNGAEGAVLGLFCDPDAAAAAHAAGEGATVSLALGGKHGPEGVVPYEADFTVTRLGDGKFKTTGPNLGGRNMDLGPMALLTVGGVSIAVTSKRGQAADQAMFRHLGVEPAEQNILALKSSVHFRADFQPISEAVIVVLAPGGHISDATQYPYRRLRRGVRLAPLGPEHRPEVGVGHYPYG